MPTLRVLANREAILNAERRSADSRWRSPHIKSKVQPAEGAALVERDSKICPDWFGGAGDYGPHWPFVLF